MLSIDAPMIRRLDSELRQNFVLQELLSRFDEIELPDAWIVAGCMAQTVWNLSAGQPAECGIKDVDLVYFDSSDLSGETEASHGQRVFSLFALDVKNEARVHLWYERRFG
jgi:hypothetical protein